MKGYCDSMKFTIFQNGFVDCEEIGSFQVELSQSTRSDNTAGLYNYAVELIISRRFQFQLSLLDGFLIFPELNLEIELYKFCEIGGLPPLLKRLLNAKLLHGDCMTVTGKTVKENLKNVKDILGDDVIKPLSSPIKKDSHIVVLKGNLSPEGSVAKISGKEGLNFEGKAVVFNSEEECMNAILNKKDFSPVKYWFENATYPSKNHRLREKFEMFFKSKITKNNVSQIIIDNTAKFKSEELFEFNWLYNCLEKKNNFIQDEIIDVFLIKNNCIK